MNTDPTGKRLAPLSLRVSREERARLEQAAGNIPLGTYIKSRLFSDGAAHPGRRTHAHDPRLLAQILARLGASGIAASLNELAVAARSGSLDCDERTAAGIAEARSDIAGMRRTLIAALGLKPSAPPPAKPNPPRVFQRAADGETHS